MKKNILKILVPYNGSKSGDKSFKNILHFAAKNQSSIILYTCIKERFSFGFFKTKNDKKILKKEKELMGKKIDNIKNTAKKCDISIKSKVTVCDFVADSIVDYAKDNNVDLIAMSKTKMSTRAEQMYYDSTVERVFKQTPCSFMYIK